MLPIMPGASMPECEPLCPPGKIAAGRGSVTASAMEFGWWEKDEEGKKHQVFVEIFGKNITWARKYGHNSSWIPFANPTDVEWDKLIAEAERRVPRRLFSQKQFEFILSQRPK